MQELNQIYEKFDITRISHFEKVLKLVQYLSRAFYHFIPKKYLKTVYKNMSLVRRILRVFNQLLVLDAINNLRKEEKLTGKRKFRFLYYFFFFIFTNLDFIILLHQIHIYKNHKIMKSIYSLTEWVWVFENSFGIIDNLIQIQSSDAKTEFDKIDFLKNDVFRLLFDTAVAISFSNRKVIGEPIICGNALASVLFSFKNLK